MVDTSPGAEKISEELSLVRRPPGHSPFDDGLCSARPEVERGDGKRGVGWCVVMGKEMLGGVRSRAKRCGVVRGHGQRSVGWCVVMGKK